MAFCSYTHEGQVSRRQGLLDGICRPAVAAVITCGRERVDHGIARFVEGDHPLGGQKHGGRGVEGPEELLGAVEAGHFPSCWSGGSGCDDPRVILLSMTGGAMRGRRVLSQPATWGGSGVVPTQ